MVQTKTLIKQNNERRKLLNEKNMTYYENLLVYIRTSPLKDDRATEEVLLELLEHLLSAQQDGKKAEDVFGKAPKELADEIIAGLPNEKPSKTMVFIAEIAAQFLGMFIALTGIAPIIKGEPKIIHIGSTIVLFAVQIVGILLLIAFLLKLLKSDAFKPNSNSKKMYWSWALASGFFILMVIILSVWVEPFGPVIEVSKYTQLFAGIMLILAAYGLKKWREAK
jgi:uncharacterized membrane-anchored protein